MAPLFQKLNHQDRCRHQQWNSAPTSSTSSSPPSSIKPGLKMAPSWSLFLSGTEGGHNDHFLMFGFFPCLTIWALFSSAAPAWQFLQSREDGKAGDTAAVWPRDRWCSYFRSYLRRPQKKIRKQPLLFIEKSSTWFVWRSQTGSTVPLVQNPFWTPSCTCCPRPTKSDHSSKGIMLINVLWLLQEGQGP